MTVNKFGNVFFKPYYILEIEKDNQTFGIYFPCYELDAIEKLTGLTAVVSDGEWQGNTYNYFVALPYKNGAILEIS